MKLIADFWNLYIHRNKSPWNYLFSLDQFGQVLTNLNKFRLFWSSLDQFEQFQTNLNLPEFSGFEGQYYEEFRPEMVFVREDGRFQCTLCESILCQLSVARTHVIQKHVVPEYFKCKICQATVKHRMSLSQHLNRKHHIKKTNKTIIQNTFQKFKKTSIIQNYLWSLDD